MMRLLAGGLGFGLLLMGCATAPNVPPRPSIPAQALSSPARQRQALPPIAAASRRAIAEALLAP